MTGVSALERFETKYEIADDCWLWTANANAEGYGRFWFDGKLGYAHRWSYLHYVGPIPDGLTVDHLCRQPRCVNPDHLDAVPQGENNRRVWRTNVERGEVASECKNGHPITLESTYVDPQGQSSCRRCKAAHARRAYRFEDTSCPVCGRRFRVSWLKRHLKKFHPDERIAA